MSDEIRTGVANIVEHCLGQSRYDVADVRVDGDRITFIVNGLACTLIVASAMPIAPTDAVFAVGCPFCGSLKPPYLEAENLDATRFTTRFVPRRGCTDCNRWWDRVRIATEQP